MRSEHTQCSHLFGRRKFERQNLLVFASEHIARGTRWWLTASRSQIGCVPTIRYQNRYEQEAEGICNQASHRLISQGLQAGRCSKSTATTLERGSARGAERRGGPSQPGEGAGVLARPLSSHRPPTPKPRSRLAHRTIRGQNQGSWKALSKLQQAPDECPPGRPMGVGLEATPPVMVPVVPAWRKPIIRSDQISTEGLTKLALAHLRLPRRFRPIAGDVCAINCQCK